MWRSKLLVALTLSLAVSLVHWGHARQKASTTEGTLTPQDYNEIQQLYARYAQTIDAGDADGWARTFTPDGVFGATKGTEKLVEFARGFYQRFKGGARHWYNQILITPTPEGAKGSCYLMLFDVGTKAITTSGIYQDTLVKTAGGWRFKERVTIVDKASPPAN
jgi:hypothetical protein